MTDFDALVIGAGHNGLVAAGYLARAGLNVCVVERREIVGGACVTEDLSSELGKQWAGMGVHTGAYVCSLFHPQIIEDLELRQFGFELIGREPSGLALFPENRHLFLYPDAERTRAELERFCPDDVESYFDFCSALERCAELVEPFFLNPALVEEIIRSAPERAEQLFLERLFTASVRDLLDAYFESEELKAVLSTDGLIGTFAGPSTPGTAYVLLHHYMGRALGERALWGFVRGGMGALTRALADAVHAAGGTVRCGAAVKKILIEDDRAAGVALADGTELRADFVLSNADAKRTFLGLVGESHLSDDFATRVKSIRMNGVSCKINLLVNELPRFSCLNRKSQIANQESPYLGTIHFCPSMDYLDEAFADARRSAPSDNPMIECTLQSVTDPSVACNNKHVISLFTQYFPYELDEEFNLDTLRLAYADRVIKILTEYAPNLPRAILDCQVLTPRDLEARFGLTGGHIFHGELLPDQIFERRFGPRTPVRGLYLCGSSSHPGGCVSGMPGWNAARAVLEDWRCTA